MNSTCQSSPPAPLRLSVFLLFIVVAVVLMLVARHADRKQAESRAQIFFAGETAGGLGYGVLAARLPGDFSTKENPGAVVGTPFTQTTALLFEPSPGVKSGSCLALAGRDETAGKSRMPTLHNSENHTLNHTESAGALAFA